MKNTNKLSIGIPAYNEGVNIKKLLHAILNQNKTGYDLLEVIVISDGSTDNTVSEVNNVKNKKIHLIKSDKRLGKSHRINQLIKKFSGEILLLLDADIEIKDANLLTKLFKNNDVQKIGLLGIKATPATAETFFQKIMNAGNALSMQISYDWNMGQNYLGFKGCFLCLSKSFAKQLKLKSSIVNNDAYIYFKALESKFNPSVYNGACVYFKSPKNFKDYLNQSKRFTSSRDELHNLFKNNLSSAYAIPNYIKIKALLKIIISNPIYISNYILIKILTIFVRQLKIKSTWNVAVSTK